MKARRNRPTEINMTIPEILAQLARHTGDFPRRALEEAVEQREAIIPELLRILEETTANIKEIAEDEDYMAHIYAMFLLAQFREKRAYPLLVGFCTADQKQFDTLMGDVTTEALDRMLASVCHGDTSLIERMVENPELNEYVRSAALESLAILVTEGVKSRDEVMAYFKSLFHGRLERESNFIWSSLVSNCRDLYPDELMPEIEQAFADGLADPMFIGMSSFRRALAAGKEAALANLASDPRQHFIEDTIRELEGWAAFPDQETKASPVRQEPPSFAPAPLRTGPKIGRNQPCPCGSGIKYKRCCGR